MLFQRSEIVTVLRRDELITAEARATGRVPSEEIDRAVRAGVFNLRDGTRLIRDNRWFHQTTAPVKAAR